MTDSLLRDLSWAYGAACAALGLFFLGLSIANTAWLRRTARIVPLESGPRVSVLVPARDEERNIRACVESLLAQEYADFDITVLDDDSSDATSAILEEMAAAHPGRLKVIRAGPLEPGWYGKPRAMHLLALQAEGDYLMFTDADTVHAPDSVGRAVALAKAWDAGFVSGYVRQLFGSFGESVVVPSIYILTIAALPLALVPRTRSPAISHAIGQFVLFRADAYRACGGFAAVRDRVSEDVRIARLVKRTGGKVLFADLSPSVSCRMYDGYSAAIEGVSKNVFDYLGKRVPVLFAATVGVTLVFLLPVAVLALSPIFLLVGLPPALAGAVIGLCASAVLNLGAWAVAAADRRLPWYLPFVHPVVMVNGLSMAWRTWRILRSGGGLTWKGRTVR